MALETMQDSFRSTFFDSAETPFILYDKRLNIIDVNEATQRLYQMNREELLGKNIVEVSPNVKLEGRYETYLNVIETGQPVVLDEVKLLLESEKHYYYRIKAFKVGDGLGIVGTEITDIKNVMDELDTFLYKSSHDIRVPISSIMGLATIAKNSTSDPDTVHNYLKMIKTEALKIDQTLQKLLKVARIQQADRTIGLIDFKLLLNNVIHTLSFVEGFESTVFQILDNSKVEFYSEISTLATVFQNILDNSIKYRNSELPKNTVSIQIEDAYNGVDITITDNGQGISKEDQAKVFKMFSRGAGQAQSAGLGLYTVKHHISSIGGSIKLESQVNTGTQLTMHIPNAKST